MKQQLSYLSRKANNVNNDMNFLNQLAKPTFQSTSIKTNHAANNINNLSQLLKLKNSKYSFSQQSKDIGQQWIKKKGADLNPLMERVKIIKQQTKNKQQQKKIQSQCHFYIPKLSLENQNQYIQKNFQFGVVSTIQSIMNEGRKQGNLAKRILKKRQILRDNGQVSLNLLPTLNLQVRNHLKKQQYLKATKQIITLQKNLKKSEWSLLYKLATKQKFWQILHNQFTNLNSNKNSNINLNININKQNKNTILSHLAIQSLKLVQQQFNQSLPSNYQSILYYLTNNYLGKMKGQYQSEGNVGPIWGICYMLYRAGRKQQFYHIIPQQQQQLKKLFQQVDKSIIEYKPKKYTIGIQQNNDLFHDQLIYALKGISKCSTQSLCNPNTLDIVWVFLRNIGIFVQDNITFISLRKQLYQSYKSSIIIITQQKIKNLLYLLCYGEIAEIGINDMMDYDDYLHYLIAIYHSYIYDILQKDKKQIIQNKLTQTLVHTIHQLLLQHKQQYIYYMIILPQNRLIQQVSSIISSSELLQTVNWKFLQQKLSQNIYKLLIQATLDKYVRLQQNYLQVARKLYQLLGNTKKSIQYILKMYIKTILSQIKYNQQQIKKAQNFISQLMKKNEENLNIRQYESIFKFFGEYFTLLQLIKQRNQSKIYKFLQNSNYILISQQLRIDVKNTLQKLIQNDGFQCYIKFVRNLIKAYQITFVRMGRLNDLEEIEKLTLNALIGLSKIQLYAPFMNSQSVKQLRIILEQALKKYY